MATHNQNKHSVSSGNGIGMFLIKWVVIFCVALLTSHYLNGTLKYVF